MKVGDYVRTECGIAKIKSFETKNKEVINLDKDIMICNMDCYRNCCTINQVIKSSPNIIDLIEVGDYVNGNKVLDIYEDINGQIRMKFGENNLILVYKSNYDNYYLFGDEINSIVTSQQFEAMQYKVGE